MTPPNELTDRPRSTIEVAAAPGGWPAPWPNVAELTTVLPADRWTLVGGLMTQLHAVHHGLGVVRPTNDVDIVLHIETSRGVPNATATALEGLGYRLRAAVNPRDNTAHRFERGNTRVDLVAATPDIVDVLISDHAAPRVIERLRGRDMVRIEGGTQALRRTLNARIEISPGTRTSQGRVHVVHDVAHDCHECLPTAGDPGLLGTACRTTWPKSTFGGRAIQSAMPACRATHCHNSWRSASLARVRDR